MEQESLNTITMVIQDIALLQISFNSFQSFQLVKRIEQ